PAETDKRRRRNRRREAVDGFWLSRTDRVVSRRRHADDRTDGKRVAGRARSILRGDDRDPRRDPGGHRGEGGPEGQRAEEGAAHGGRGRRRRLAACLLMRAGGVSAAVRPRVQILAERRADRQPLRRSKSY